MRSIAVVSSPLMELTGYTNYNLHHIVDWFATFKYLAGDKSASIKPLDGKNIWNSISKNMSARNEVISKFKYLHFYYYDVFKLTC